LKNNKKRDYDVLKEQRRERKKKKKKKRRETVTIAVDFANTWIFAEGVSVVA
jgi:hypothetical protein